ncbi:MAG TPA: pitrilysin family protein [Allosphingosinicella sp.]
MRRTFAALTAAAALLLAGCAAPNAEAPKTAATAPAAENAPLASLVRTVDIPYQRFTLDNGLRVLVHEDHKAPVVAVSVWYNVGSKDEPKGKTGFAHLFEHLMFNGSENAPGDFFEPLKQVGATDFNGTTWFDRTNYFETVPKAALETALFLESDRMGHLLGAVTQEKLDNQRGVVQNEKRQGDNQPFGLVEYAQLAALFPDGHPYRHSTIGSMADLDSASLADVKQWFRDKYGPNNSVLVLAGDIDLATARTLVQKYFGDIPKGPVNTPAAASVPTLAAPVSEVMKDRVANVRLYRDWIVPGLGDPDLVPLDVGASVLGGLASSRLDNELVRKDQTAVRVSANVQPFQRMSMFEVQVDVKPGADADAVAARLDAILADLIANGPTEDEVRRVAMTQVSSRIRGLEQVGGFGGKAVALAEGELYLNDPEFYKKQLLAYSTVTPAEVRTALQKWLSRPVYALRVVPGERDAYEEAGASKGSAFSAPRYYRTPKAGEQPLAPMPKSFVDVDRSKLPEVGPIADLDFPDIERTTLSNGMKVAFARRAAVPVVLVSLQFDAGYASDPKDKLGLQRLMAALMEEGTTSLDSRQLAEAQERLGASVDVSSKLDRTTATLTALSANLGPSLDLLADVVKNPAFAPSEVERLRGQQLAGIASELTSPTGIAMRTLPPLVFGDRHPYGVPFTGSGSPQALAAITRDDVVAAHRRWIRPDNAEIFVVGDTTLADVKPLLEARFGNWTAPQDVKGVKDFAQATPAAKPRIVLIDRPQSPQSMILAGEIMPVVGTDQNILTLITANDVLGGDFLSRLNMDLRETKGWSYGVSGIVYQTEHQVPYLVFAPVQANQTGPAIAALQEQMKGFLGKNGVTAAELVRTINGAIRELPGSYETSPAILGAMQNNALYKRPDNYQETLASRYRALTAADLDKAARAAIDPGKLVWVVVGDAKAVRPQLEKLGLPIEVMALK